MSRRAIIDIPMEVLIEILKRYAIHIPADAKAIASQVGNFQVIEVLFESQLLPDIAEGCQYPHIPPEERLKVSGT